MERDLDLCRRLVGTVLDPEKGIRAMDKLEEHMQTLQKTEQLDYLLLYMRRVHAYCLYCGEEYDDERMLAAKCGP